MPTRRSSKVPMKAGSSARSTVDRHRETRERVLQQLEDDTGLRERRDSFCQQLREAAGKDQSVTDPQARKRIRSLTERAHTIEKLEQLMNSTAARFESALEESAHWLGWWPSKHMDYDAPFSDDVNEIKSNVLAALRDDLKTTQSATKWHRSVLIQKKTQ